MSEQVYEQLTLFPAGSPVSRSLLPGSEEARRTTVTSGRRCAELLQSSAPVGLLARMLLESSHWRSTRCYLTWKESVTPAKRLLFRLVPSTPRTGGTDVQSWPTPTAADSFVWNLKSSEQNGTRHSLNLADAVKLWPTMTASNYRGRWPNSKQQGLPEAVRMFPTARARDWKGPGHPDDLPSYAAMFPTPSTGAGLCGVTGDFKQLQKLKEQGQISEEERRNMSQGNGGQLNPTWVEWLMGFPRGAPYPYITFERGYIDESAIVFCNACKISVKLEENDQEGFNDETERKAIEAWNRRASDGVISIADCMEAMR